MGKIDLDQLDKNLILLLSEDGRTPVTEISQRLGVTDPTVRARMERLAQAGVLQISGLINLFKIKGMSLAIIAITLDDHKTLEETLQEISQLPSVTWAVVVTGRYDIMCEVLVPDEGTDYLYWFLTKKLAAIKSIREFETSVVLNAKGKWIAVPSNIGKWLEKSPKSVERKK